jgi:uncharacterized protein with PIN domain/sulfur carrier protein ThiS
MKPFPIIVPSPASVRELLRTIPVPENEVDLVLVNGQSVHADQQLKDGDKISLYPVFESFDISPLVKLREQPLRETRFVLDTHLGKLSTYLRMLGFDSLYRPDYRDDELLAISLGEERTLLSRDRELVVSKQLTRAYQVRETDPHLQVREVVERFDLRGSLRPFIRCMRCNTLLRTIEKEEVLERLPPRIQEMYEEFQICPTCDRIYWRGSHYERMSEFIEVLLHTKGTTESQQ